MALFHTIKPKETYKLWLASVLQYATPPVDAKAIQIEIINDQYLDDSTKSSTRAKRGQASRRVHLQSVEQKMMQGKDWQEFLHNDANKENLIQIAADFFRSAEGRKLLTIPLIITCKDEAWEISKTSVKALPRSNHEEADTKIILHASSIDTAVVVVAKDTDVFVLLVYAMQNCSPSEEWYMCIDNNKYVKIRNIIQRFGSKICNALPQVHAITGSDATAYKYNVGKIKVIKKLMAKETHCDLIQDLGKDESLSDTIKIDAKRFVQTVMYSGKIDESYVNTRIRLYQGLKTKSSAVIPADPKSIDQELLRVNLTCFIWLRCLDKVVTRPDPKSSGWHYDEALNRLVPTWYTEALLPPSLTSSKKPRKSKKNISAIEKKQDADSETDMSDTNDGPLPKRLKPSWKEFLVKATAVSESRSSGDEKHSTSSEWEQDFTTSEEEMMDSSDSDYFP
eukprot:gene12581-biopygen10020